MRRFAYFVTLRNFVILIIEKRSSKREDLKSDSHVLQNFCQIKTSPSLVRKNTIICLFEELKINEFQN